MRRLTRVATGLAAALAVGTAAGAPAGAVSGAPSESLPVDLRVQEVDPGWVASGEELVLRSRFTARDDASARDVHLTLSVADPLTSRDAVNRWLENGTGPEGRQQDDVTVDRVTDGSGAVLRMSAPQVASPVVLPLTVTATGEIAGERRVLDVERTVLPVLPGSQPGGSADTPRVRLGWLLPVTTGLRDEQFAADDEVRSRAWRRALDESGSVQAASRLGERVTSAVDPAVAERLPDDLATEVLGGDNDPWRLPRHAVDAVDLGTDDSGLWKRATRSSTRTPGPVVIDMSSRLGRRGSDDATLQRLVAGSGGTPVGRTVLLAPTGFREDGTASGATASDDPGNWWHARRVGWVDQGISHHLTARNGTPEDAGGAAMPAQALLALSLVSGSTDSPEDLVVRPEADGVDPTSLERAVEVAESAPWVESLPASRLLGCGARSCGSAPEHSSAATWSGVEPTDRELSPVEPRRELEQEATSLAGVATGTAREQLLGIPVARHARGWVTSGERDRATGHLERTVVDLTHALEVEGSTVNLLADSATLRATVANRGDRSLENLHVVVRPMNNRVTVEQPEAIDSLSPSGRVGVSFTARAHAAGQVPVRVMVTTPDGRVVLARSEVSVNARPSDGWWYAGLGIVTALLIGFGSWRTIRQVRSQNTLTDPGDTP